MNIPLEEIYFALDKRSALEKSSYEGEVIFSKDISTDNICIFLPWISKLGPSFHVSMKPYMLYSIGSGYMPKGCAGIGLYEKLAKDKIKYKVAEPPEKISIGFPIALENSPTGVVTGSGLLSCFDGKFCGLTISNAPRDLFFTDLETRVNSIKLWLNSLDLDIAYVHLIKESTFLSKLK